MTSIGRVLLFVQLSLCAFDGVGAQTRKVVMVHGGGSSGETWQTGATWLQSNIAGLPPVQRPNISQSVSLYVQGELLRDSILLNMPADQALLVAHSNGGLMSRRASQFLAPLGIVTVATPHIGIPLATQVGAIIATLNLNTFFLAEVLLLSAYPLAFGYTGLGPVFYVQASAFVAALATEVAYVYGLNPLAEAVQPFIADEVPGAPFLQQLPTGGTNRFSISVVDASGAAPWSLAMSPSAAQTAMYIGTGSAVGLYYSAVALFDYIEWSVPDAIWAYLYVGSAVSLANLLIDVPGHWCTLVGAGVCLPSDGFITTSHQAYPGGVDEAIVDAAHTRQTQSAGILSRVEARVRTILGL